MDEAAVDVAMYERFDGRFRTDTRLESSGTCEGSPILQIIGDRRSSCCGGAVETRGIGHPKVGLRAALESQVQQSYDIAWNDLNACTRSRNHQERPQEHRSRDFRDDGFILTKLNDHMSRTMSGGQTDAEPFTERNPLEGLLIIHHPTADIHRNIVAFKTLKTR
jgi:hypothetical protein